MTEEELKHINSKPYYETVVVGLDDKEVRSPYRETHIFIQADIARQLTIANELMVKRNGMLEDRMIADGNYPQPVDAIGEEKQDYLKPIDHTAKTDNPKP